MVRQILRVSVRHRENLHQYIQFERKGKEMNAQQFLEYFRQLPPSTQIVLIFFVLVIIVMVVVDPSAGTNVITFLLGSKCSLVGREERVNCQVATFLYLSGLLMLYTVAEKV